MRVTRVVMLFALAALMVSVVVVALHRTVGKPFEEPEQEAEPLVGSFALLPLIFEENQGQAHSQVEFVAHGKGMALFPRKIRGQYAMLSRQDGVNNAIMFSDNLHFWQQAQILQEPEFPYEFFQIGNGGSPIETAEGWLVITHGVGPMRTYSLGIELLDLDDPTRVISRIDEPILVPNEHDREGYVPNVIYSCGAMICQDELNIPYASADQRCGIATLNLPKLMARLRYNKTLRNPD